ncbi:hypothetical protein C8Q69DRAFT_507993 [Paecilomyces variotii]|uniref:Mid2 domain-containing protein n=1 Tax=Byssochlamys spectabilis TaxID=264951 RepID=A0A443HS63_BYSSP|nr:hypothetical protein C8Q69DRAFT_507993 [Paecilomyces variotii]KAJ9365396.1 hypothetical protein DTO280E4_365 [Paecilomyces variotii]RWQ94627.1 hypothetical protein C8Q69DRAFT_507993 [Paecilomyces variotii]
MRFIFSVFVLSWITFCVISADSITRDVLVDTHQIANNLNAFRRNVLGAPVKKRDRSYSNYTSIEKSFHNAVLFALNESQTNVGITCRTCYILGNASVHFSTDGDFNASAAVDSIAQDVQNTIINITDAVEQAIKDTAENITQIAQHLIHGDFEDVTWPTLPVDFNMDIQGIPQSHLTFQFDDLELYVELETAIANGSYTLNLYRQQTPLGIGLASQNLGVFFSVDLVLSTTAEVDMISGFHIKFDDSVIIKMDFFDTNFSDITYGGGHYEFLPVTVMGSIGILNAVLRVGINTGFNVGIGSDFSVSILDEPVTIPSASIGTAISVFADIAEFTTNLTTDSESCDILASEKFKFGIGAGAGATLAINDNTWGPTPSVTTALFKTDLGGICATQSSSTPATTTVEVERRQQSDLKSTTTKTYKTTSTLHTLLPSGSTFPSTTSDTVSRIAFGDNVKSMEKTSGNATPYIAESTGFQEYKKIIIGVTIPVGIILIAGFL